MHVAHGRPCCAKVADVAEEGDPGLRPEDCKRFDRCLSVQSLRRREWAGETELAMAIREVCETCPGPPGMLPPEPLESSRTRPVRVRPYSDGRAA